LGPVGSDARAVISAADVAWDARAARYVLYGNPVMYTQPLFPRLVLSSWNVILTVIGSEMEFSMAWTAALIVPSMVAALGSFVIVLSKVALIVSESSWRGSSCST